MHTMSSKTHPRTHTHIFSNTNIFFFCYYYKLISKKNIKLKQILINFNHFKVNPFQFQKGHFLNIGPMLSKLDKTRQNSVQQSATPGSQLVNTDCVTGLTV